MRRILLRLAFALGLLVAACRREAFADPTYNSSISVQPISGMDFTRPASRDNPLPIAPAPANGPAGLAAVSVGTASKEVLSAAGGPWRWRFVQNTDGGLGLWCAFGAAATKAPPSLYLAPREKLTFGAGGGFVPTGAVNCIADALGGTVAVTAGQAGP